MIDIVDHFERYPRIKHPDGRTATPDFTVLFKDGVGLAAEIAHLGLHEGSVEKLTQQVSRYDSLTELPCSGHLMASVSDVDVLLIVPAEVSNDAVDRIIQERFLAVDHKYKPRRPPCVLSVSRDSDKYSFVRNRDSVNGILSIELLQRFLNKSGYKARGTYWTPVKSDRPFVNDPVDALYLASIVWIKISPQMQPGVKSFAVSSRQIAKVIADNFGHSIGVSEIRRTMVLLVRGGFAEPTRGSKDSWRITRRRIVADGGDFVRQLADRATNPHLGSAARVIGRGRRSASPTAGQIELFNPLA